MENSITPVNYGLPIPLRTVCDQLGVSRRWVYDMIDRGKLRQYKIGKKVFFKASEIMAALEEDKRGKEVANA